MEIKKRLLIDPEVAKKIDQSMGSIQTPIKRYKGDTLRNTFFSIFSPDLTSKRQAMLDKVESSVTNLESKINEEACLDSDKIYAFKTFRDELKHIQKENDDHSREFGKENGSGRVSTIISKYKEEIKFILNSEDDVALKTAHLTVSPNHN